MEELIIAHIIATTFFPAPYENKNSIGDYAAMKRDYINVVFLIFKIPHHHRISQTLKPMVVKRGAMGNKFCFTFWIIYLLAPLTILFYDGVKSMLLHVVSYKIPICQVPECSHIIRASITVINIISMFPHIAG